MQIMILEGILNLCDIGQSSTSTCKLHELPPGPSRPIIILSSYSYKHDLLMYRMFFSFFTRERKYMQS